MKRLLLFLIVLLPFAAQAQTPVSNNFQFNTPKQADNRTGKFASGAWRPYTSVSEANSSIPQAYRADGLTVQIRVGGVLMEYWYDGCIQDNCLVLKSVAAEPDSSKWATVHNVQQQLAAYVPTPLWSNIQSKPSSFAPSAHTHPLSDLSQSGATSGQVPIWNGTNWAPGTVSGGGGEPVIPAGTTLQYWRGDKTWQPLNVAAVTGLNDSLSAIRAAGGSGSTAWSSITGKPTTLSGYGITDAVPTSRTINGMALTGNLTIDKASVGLSNVPNVDATSRANHTGTQAISTVTGLPDSLSALRADIGTGGAGGPDPATPLVGTTWNLTSDGTKKTITLSANTSITAVTTNGQEGYLWVTGNGYTITVNGVDVVTPSTGKVLVSVADFNGDVAVLSSADDGGTYTPPVASAVLTRGAGQQQHHTLFEHKMYSGFPHMVKFNDGKIGMYARESQSHVSNGALNRYFSNDGGNSWGEYGTTYLNGDTLKTDGLNLGTDTLTGEIWLMQNRQRNDTPRYDTVFFCKSTDGINFTQVDKFPLPSYLTHMVPFGNMIQLPSGKMMASGYAVDTGGRGVTLIWQKPLGSDEWDIDPNSVIVSGVGKGLIMGLNSSLFSFSEGTLVLVPGATDNTSTIVRLVRTDGPYKLTVQYVSHDGGTTYKFSGSHRYGYFSYGPAYGIQIDNPQEINWPTYGFVEGDRIYTVQGVRNTSASYPAIHGTDSLTEGGFYLRVMSAPLATGLDTTDAKSVWTDRTYHYRSLAGERASVSDFGYAYPYRTPQGWSVALYDAAPNWIRGVTGTQTTARLRVQTLPLFNQHATEALNFSHNQTIVSGSETVVDYRMMYIDTDGMRHRDSNKLYAQKTGWYHVSAGLAYQGAVGGERFLTCWAVDPGNEFSNQAIVNALAKRIILHTQITPADTNSWSNYLQGSGLVYLHAGQEIRLTTRHTYGSDLYIDNRKERQYSMHLRIKYIGD